MRNFFTIGSFILLIACASIAQPYYYNEVVVQNNTRELIRDVVIRADVSNRMFSCGNIAPGASCSNKFQKREYQNNKLSITWEYRGISRTKNNIMLDVPQHMKSSVPLRGVIAIQPDGSAKVWLEQGVHR